MRVEEVADCVVGACAFAGATAARERARETVEADDLAEHVPERRPEQVRALREHAAEAGAAPFDPGGRNLGRERHVGSRRGHAELGEQGDELRVSTPVEDEKAGIDAESAAVEGDVDGLGVAAEMVACLEERHPGAARELTGGGEPGDSGADDGDPLHRAAAPEAGPPDVRCGRKKGVAERPRGNEGGRREEENPPRISAGTAGRLRDENRLGVPAARAATVVDGCDGRLRARRTSLTRLGRPSSQCSRNPFISPQTLLAISAALPSRSSARAHRRTAGAPLAATLPVCGSRSLRARRPGAGRVSSWPRYVPARPCDRP